MPAERQDYPTGSTEKVFRLGKSAADEVSSRTMCDNELLCDRKNIRYLAPAEFRAIGHRLALGFQIETFDS